MEGADRSRPDPRSTACRGRRRARMALAALCLCLSTGAWASDLKREKGWADLLQGHLDQGRAVWLTAEGGQKVFAIYEAPLAGAPRGGVVLAHDMGQHPDWPEVIAPLRTGLPHRGWATLSVQMPVLADGATPDQYAPLVAQAAARLKAAVDYLVSRNVTPVALVGYGLGGTMAAAYLAGNPPGPVSTFIAISSGSIPGTPAPLDTAAYLAKVPVPSLAVYGSRDYEWVLRSAPHLAAAARGTQTSAAHQGNTGPSGQPPPAAAGPRPFRQTRITGADHGYRGVTDELIEDVVGWLNRTSGRTDRASR